MKLLNRQVLVTLQLAIKPLANDFFLDGVRISCHQNWAGKREQKMTFPYSLKCCWDIEWEDQPWTYCL
jgi:hypothetical protein